MLALAGPLRLFGSSAVSVEGYTTKTGRVRSEYWVENQQIFTNAFGAAANLAATELHLKGAVWSGFESAACTYGGAWTEVPLAAYIELLRKEGFNAIRLPLPRNGCPSLLDDLEKFILTAGDHGMTVLLSGYAARAGVENANGYIGGAQGLASLTAAWERLATRFCEPARFWNVIGADLMNSPHGMYWGPAPLNPPPPPSSATAAAEFDPHACRPGHEGFDACPPPPPPPSPPPHHEHYFPGERWDTAASKLGGAVLAKCSRWLLFVQGVGYCEGTRQSRSQQPTPPVGPSAEPMAGCAFPSAAGQDPLLTLWWAENLQAAAAYPLSLPPQKVVYAPQVGAPSSSNHLLTSLPTHYTVGGPNSGYLLNTDPRA
jgi:hypothetical protein